MVRARIWVLVTVWVVLGACIRDAGAQGAYRLVSLRVTDERTQSGLPGVRVTIEGVTDRDWMTNEQGYTLVAVARTTAAVLLVRHPGYVPVRVSSPAADDSTAVALVMRRNVQSLDTTRVIGEQRSAFLEEFETRRLRGTGAATFITREQIEKRMPVRTIDIVRRAVGTKVVDSAGVLMLASSRLSKPVVGIKRLDLVPCVFRVAVDGVLRNWGFSLDEIDPKEIHGIEVYPGPSTIPAQYALTSRDAACGMVLIWTRRGP